MLQCVTASRQANEETNKRLFPSPNTGDCCADVATYCATPDPYSTPSSTGPSPLDATGMSMIPISITTGSSRAYPGAYPPDAPGMSTAHSYSPSMIAAYGGVSTGTSTTTTTDINTNSNNKPFLPPATSAYSRYGNPAVYAETVTRATRAHVLNKCA